MSWMNERAEAAMREAGKKIMEEAAKRKELEVKSVDKLVGKWTITMMGNDALTHGEIEEFMNKILTFSKEADDHAPNLRVSIDPVI